MEMKEHLILSRSAGTAALAACAFIGVCLIVGRTEWTAPAATVAFSALAILCWARPPWKGFAFAAWVFAFVAAALAWPDWFGSWFGFDLGILIVPLIQIIMFGMGTTLSVADFRRVFTMPLPVLLGMVLQFSVMPIVGLLLAKLFQFPPEVAAGVVLIGSCPGGVASNLMAYLARGNVALSVTMTACSTLMSPVMTPFLMKVLAGQFIEIKFFAMMLSILNMIIVPVVAGLIANRILYGRRTGNAEGAPLATIAGSTLVVAALLLWLPPAWLGPLAPLQTGLVIGLGLVGVVAVAKWWVAFRNGPENWMDRVLPQVSMFGICFIIAIITARSSDTLLAVGPALMAAAILHNLIGYLSGYWGARATRFDETTCRTIAFEVGMQNGGMASGLAMNLLKNAQTALAPALFGPWMNISGSVLAAWWKRR